VKALKKKAGTWEEPGERPYRPMRPIRSSFLCLARYRQPREVTPGFFLFQGKHRAWRWDNQRFVVRYDQPKLRENGKPKKEFKPYCNGKPGKGDTLWGLYNLEAAMQAKGKTLLMVEGEGCTDTAAQLGLVAVTMQGSEWQKEKVIEALKPLAGVIAGLVAIPDKDATGEKKSDLIRGACQHLGIPYTSMDMTSLWTECPEHGDITDWYEAGRASPEALRQAIKKSWKLPKPEPEAEEEREENRPTPVQFAQKLGKTQRFRWRFHNEQKSWREWDGKHWRAVSQEKIGDFIYHQAKHHIKSNAWVKDCQALLERELREEEWMAQSQSVRAFANGVVDIASMELSPHDPSHYNTSFIRRDWWQPEGNDIKDPLQALKQYCPHIYEAWHHAMGGDERKILKLLAICNGVMTWQCSPFQKFIHLIGRPGTGKGTFSRLLSALVGKENAKSSKLAKLGSDYDIAHWIDSQLVVFPDEGGKLSGSALDNFKSITGGDPISYRQIYGEVASGPYQGTVLIISNDPLFRGETGPIKRRLCLVEFDQPIANRSHLAERLMMREIPQLTYCALSLTPHKVEAIIKGLGEYDIPEFQSKHWELEMAENSVADFLDTELIPLPDCQARVKFLYENYCQFCSGTGQKPVAMNKFSSRLLSASDFVGWEVDKGKDRKGAYVVGVGLRDEDYHRDIPTPSEVLKQAEKVLPPNQLSQPSEPSPDEQISPKEPERDDRRDDTVTIPVTAETLTQQGRDGCDDTLPLLRTEEKTEGLKVGDRTSTPAEEPVQTSLPKKGDRVYVPLDGQWELVDVKQVHKRTFSAFRITQYDRETLETPIVHGLKEWRPKPDPVYIYESAGIKDKKGWVQGWYITRIDRTHYHCRLAGVNESKAIGKREVSRADLKFPDWVYEPVEQ